MSKFIRAVLACVLVFNFNVLSFAASNPELGELIRKKEANLQTQLAEVTTTKGYNTWLNLDPLAKAFYGAVALAGGGSAGSASL